MSSHRTIAIIPARAGSKGIPNKNLSHLGSLTLLARAVLVAQEVPGIDEIIVSTDGEDIAAEARRYGATIHERPRELSTDEAKVLPVILHVRDQFDPTERPRYGVLLEPTSPFRAVEDVTACLEAVWQGADSAATFTEASLHPHRAFRLQDGRVETFLPGVVPWRPRQQLTPPAYQLTGGAYALDLDGIPEDGDSVVFGRVAPVMMPRERALDIDDPLDLRLANAILGDELVPTEHVRP